MIRDLAATLLLLAAASPALAQGFSPPGGAGQADPGAAPPPATQSFPQAGPMQSPPTPQPPYGGQAGAMPPGGYGSFPSPGGVAPSQQAEPTRPNYADELTNFGVPPQSTLQANIGSPTPLTIPVGHVITTNEMKQAVGSDIVFIDVWEQPSHPSIPGAIPMPGAGSPGSFNDDTQQRLWNALSQVTNRQAQRPIVFFCTGSRCWESYNAALRAVNMGFKMVLWYRGGLAAWQAAGQRMTVAGQTSSAPPPGHVGFNQ